LQLHPIEPIAATADAPKSPKIDDGVAADLNEIIPAQPAQYLSQRIIGRKFLEHGVNPCAPATAQHRNNFTARQQSDLIPICAGDWHEFAYGVGEPLVDPRYRTGAAGRVWNWVAPERTQIVSQSVDRLCHTHRVCRLLQKIKSVEAECVNGANCIFRGEDQPGRLGKFG
jgi:hypothetical protein